jgi:hypothetical protein
MAHMAKFKGAAAAHIIGHCERERSNEGYLKYHNGSEIDENRTKLNVSFYDQSGHKMLKNRLEEVAPKRRKDAVTMVDWVVTLPEQLFDYSREQQLDFFYAVKDFLDRRYGEKNCCGAYIHFDETTPHLHYTFVPVVSDPENGHEKLCCKDLMRKAELNAFHRELDREMAEKYGLKGLILNGKTRAQGGNLEIAELREQKKHAERLEKTNSALSHEKQQKIAEIENLILIEGEIQQDISAAKTISQQKAELIQKQLQEEKLSLEAFEKQLNDTMQAFRSSNPFFFLRSQKTGETMSESLLRDPNNKNYFDIKTHIGNRVSVRREMFDQYFQWLMGSSYQQLSPKLDSLLQKLEQAAELDPAEKYQELLQREKAVAQKEQRVLRLHDFQLNLNNYMQQLVEEKNSLEKQLKSAWQDMRSLQDQVQRTRKQLCDQQEQIEQLQQSEKYDAGTIRDLRQQNQEYLRYLKIYDYKYGKISEQEAVEIWNAIDQAERKAAMSKRISQHKISHIVKYEPEL